MRFFAQIPFFARPLVRSMSRFLRKSLPRIFLRGGAVHRSWNYDLAGTDLRRAIREGLPDEKLLGIPVRRLRRLRWIRFNVRLTPGTFLSTLELRLEPGLFPGRMILKIFPERSSLLLERWNARLYEKASGRPIPAPSRFHHLLRILCRMPLLPVNRIRFGSLFFFPTQDSSECPPFHRKGNHWILHAALFGLTEKGAILFPSFFNWNFRRISWLMQPVELIRSKDGRHLSGYLVTEYPPPDGVVRAGKHYELHMTDRRLIMRPGRYGGFDMNFPFQSTENDSNHLFYEDIQGNVHAFEIIADYPANHLQRFSVTSLPARLTPDKKVFYEGARKTEVIPSPIVRALYLSHMDVHVKARFKAHRSDFLWRLALDPVPELEHLPS